MAIGYLSRDYTRIMQDYRIIQGSYGAIELSKDHTGLWDSFSTNHHRIIQKNRLIQMNISLEGKFSRNQLKINTSIHLSFFYSFFLMKRLQFSDWFEETKYIRIFFSLHKEWVLTIENTLKEDFIRIIHIKFGPVAPLKIQM